MAPCFAVNPMSGVAIRSWQVDFEPVSSSGASSELRSAVEVSGVL
jgi:hypothetical protein